MTRIPGFRRVILSSLLLLLASMVYSQAPGCEAEANSPVYPQYKRVEKTQAVLPVSQKGKKKNRKIWSNTENFSDLVISVARNPAREAGFLVTISFESSLRAQLHVNVLNRKNRIKHSEVYSARKGRNLLLLDIESLNQGDYRILISKGDQYVKSDFIKI